MPVEAKAEVKTNKGVGELKALYHNAVEWAKGSDLKWPLTGETIKASGVVLLFVIIKCPPD